MVDTAAARALRERRKNRNLPAVEIPKVSEDELARALHGIQEHLRMYEGDSGAPKERFVTLAELENAGIIKADVKTKFAYISQALGEDVAQMAGSTSNPTLTTRSTRDTSRTSRTPGGSDGGGALTCKITVVIFLPRYIFQNRIPDFAAYTYTDILSHRETAYQAPIHS